MENLSTSLLPELPSEILFLIADHTRSYSAISALARTSRRFHEVLNPYLYRINSQQAQGGFALLWAARYGNEATLRLALKSPERLVSSRPLLIAARYGHTEVVKHLLSVTGVDIHATDDEGNTALARATAAGHAEVVKHLLSVTGVDIHATDNEGNTALARAIAAGHEEVVNILLDAGALPDPRTSPGSYQKQARSALFHAIESGHTCIVKQLLARGRINVRSKYRDHRTALSLSAKLGHLELVQLFSDLGVPVNTRHPKDHTPLTYAIESGSPDVVRVLLESGADPNSLQQPDQNTPIFLALRCMEPRGPVLQALVDNPKIDMNHVNKDVDSSLSFAFKTWPLSRYFYNYRAKCSDEEIAILLTRKDLDPNINNAFATAIYQDRLTIAETIFDNPQLTRESKFSGLQRIISCRCAPPKPTCEAMFTPLFEYFLANCLDIDEPVFDGMSLLMFAAFHGHERAVDLLLEHGVHPDSRAYANSHVAVHYVSPLHCAIQGGNVNILERLLRTGEVDLNYSAGAHGFNAFLSAVDSGNTNVLRILREMTDTNPNVTDARGMCAAVIVLKQHVATANRLLLLRELLQWNGVDVRIVDDQGKSALDYARECYRKDLEVMLRLYLDGQVILPAKRRIVRGRKSRNGKKGQQTGDTETLWRCYGVLGGDTLYSTKLIRGD